jgi:hypothetical protein
MTGGSAPGDGMATRTTSPYWPPFRRADFDQVRLIGWFPDGASGDPYGEQWWIRSILPGLWYDVRSGWRWRRFPGFVDWLRWLNSETSPLEPLDGHPLLYGTPPTVYRVVMDTNLTPHSRQVLVCSFWAGGRSFKLYVRTALSLLDGSEHPTRFHVWVRDKLDSHDRSTYALPHAAMWGGISEEPS